MFQCPHLQKENYNSTCFLSGCENYIAVVEALRMLIPSMCSMNIDYCCYALDVPSFPSFLKYCLHYISPRDLSFSLGFHPSTPLFSLCIPAWIMSFFLMFPHDHLLLVSQSLDVSKYSGNPKSINWIQYFALKPTFPFLFSILLLIHCQFHTIAMELKSDLGPNPSLIYASCEILGNSVNPYTLLFLLI